MCFSRTQKSIPFSSTKAEYIATADSVKDALFPRQMLTSMRPLAKLEAVALCEERSGGIHLANNPMQSAGSKHIGIRHHFIRDVVKRGDIRIVHTETKLQHPDFLDENLGGNAFRKHRRYVMNFTLEY